MIVVTDPSVRSLSGLKPHYRGRNGDRGSGGYRLGSTGRTAFIKVTRSGTWSQCGPHVQLE